MRTALLDLIERKPFEKISIKEITDVAGLSYPTFFRRFANKNELLEEIAAEEVRVLLALSQGVFDSKGGGNAAELCRYIHSHRKLWTVLLNGGAAYVMREEFKRIAEAMARTRPRANPWLPIDLAVPYVTSGIFEILAWWLRQPADYPLEDVVALFNALIVDVTARPRFVPILNSCLD